ncbi:putative Late nodulin [Medicago truncatula]|uniref:Putative Late nodulin n=1 Tax=Medicago truncatula TaxID=3880 RepID=A0A396GLD7_MEDTR|nr:putative Late nodulin [Medicago truncatula]
MAEMFKFFYTMIILVSLFLVVSFSNEECTSDADCYKIYPHLSLLHIRCFEGICFFTFFLPGYPIGHA